MKIISILSLNKVSLFIAMLVAVGGQSAIADNIIYEGVSVPGGFYIGMSRDEVNQIGGIYLPYGDDDSRDCSSGSKCTFRSGEDELNRVSFIFDNDHVVQLEILKLNFGGPDKLEELETSIGATPKMSPEEVAALYPGAVITDTGSRKKEVVVAKRGYTFKSRLQCPYSSSLPCTRGGTHRIYKPTNGVVDSYELLQTFLSGKRGSQRIYKFIVPEGKNNLKVAIYGGSGDADLYVKKASVPTLRSYDCRPYKDGNRESCRLSLGAGIYYIMVRGYSAYSGLSVRGSSN